MTKDRRLGRGLAALLGTPLEEGQLGEGGLANESPDVGELRVAPGTERASKVTGSVPLPGAEANRIRSLELNVDEIDNNPFQPRRKFNEEEIASLAASIKEHKQLQPILVRKVGERYQLISGERRLRATIHAGLKTIRAEVRQADDRLVAELAIVENLQRKDLDAIEKALSFRRYLDEHKCTQEDLAKRLKIDRSTIANLMRLLELPSQIQDWIQSDKITAGHARSLLPLGDDEQQLIFAQRIMEHGWSVRDTEKHVAKQLESEDGAIVPAEPKQSTRKRVMTPQIASLEQRMRLSMGTKVEIRQGVRGNGKISISFANPEEFERIAQLICPERKVAAA